MSSRACAAPSISSRGGGGAFRRKRKICFSVWVVVALGPFRCLRGPALPGFGAGRVRKLFEVPSMFRRCSVVPSMFRRLFRRCSVHAPGTAASAVGCRDLWGGPGCTDTQWKGGSKCDNRHCINQLIIIIEHLDVAVRMINHDATLLKPYILSDDRQVDPIARIGYSYPCSTRVVKTDH